MRKSGIIIIALLALTLSIFAQDTPVKFTVEVSTDSLLMENPLQVRFTLENGNGQSFEAPSFTGFQIVSGPNVSTSMSMINGAVTQSASYSFLLMPEQTGNYFIEPASVSVEGEILETLPVEVIVVPNPDGIQQSPAEQRLGQNDFPVMPEPHFFNFGSEDMRKQMEEFGFDLDEMEFPDLNGSWFNFPGLDGEQFPLPMPAPREESPKKKRKTYKL